MDTTKFDPEIFEYIKEIAPKIKHNCASVMVGAGLSKQRKLKLPTDVRKDVFTTNYDTLLERTLEKITDTSKKKIISEKQIFSIVYNGNNKEETVSLEALENSSTLFSSGAPNRVFITDLSYGHSIFFAVLGNNYFSVKYPNCESLLIQAYVLSTLFLS